MLLSAAAHLGQIQVLKTQKPTGRDKKEEKTPARTEKYEYEGGNKRISLFMQ